MSRGDRIWAIAWLTSIDKGAVTNHAMFIDSPGYVLKPLALRQKSQEISQRYRIRVVIISAQRLPPSTDLFVEASINCVSRKTSPTKSIAFNPLWNETLEFYVDATPTMLSLTCLHLEIKNRTLLAQWVRPLSVAPHGYHHLPLYDSLFSRYVFATLFVRIDIDNLHGTNSEWTTM